MAIIVYILSVFANFVFNVKNDPHWVTVLQHSNQELTVSAELFNKILSKDELQRTCTQTNTFYCFICRHVVTEYQL